MTTDDLEQAKRNAVLARRRLDTSLEAVQHRLSPGNLAGEAWDGVKEKSVGIADGALTSAKERPVAVAGAVTALLLFLARKPIGRTVGRWVTSDPEEDGRVVTRIETDDPRLTTSTPIVDAHASEGVIG